MSLNIRIYGDTLTHQIASELQALGLSPNIQHSVIETRCDDVRTVKEVITRYQVAAVQVQHGTLVAI